MPTLIQKKFNSAGGSGVDFTTFTDLSNYLKTLDLVALDQDIQILITGTLTLPNAGGLGAVTVDDTHRVRLMPDPASAVNTLERSVFSQGTSGAAIAISRDYTYAPSLGSGVDIYGMRILVTGAAGSTKYALLMQTKNTATSVDNYFKYNRIYDTSLGASTSQDTSVFRSGISGSRVMYSDNLFVVDSAAGKTLIGDSGGAQTIRNTFVAIGAAKGASTAIRDGYGGYIWGNLFLSFSELFGTGTGAAYKGVNFSNVAPTTGTTTGFTVVTGVDALVVNDASDFRPKSGGALINAGGDNAKSTLDILGNNRGLSPDVGAWQLVPGPPLPGATITAKTVTGTTVTISGVTSNTPTEATASLGLVNLPYNGGVAQGPVTVTLGSGTFTATFTNVKVGRYNPTVTLSNAGGAASAINNIGNLDIVGATGAITSQSLDGQLLTISGTTSGSPTSGVLYVPASSTNANGAYTTGPSELTLGAGTFTCTVSLSPGNYDAPVVLLSTAAGTSLPISGSVVPVSVIGIYGNPEAPPPEGSATPISLPPDMFIGVSGTTMRFGKS